MHYCTPSTRLVTLFAADPYNDKVLPEAPRELVTELSRRYVQLYEMITGESFVLPDLALDPGTRMKAAIKGAGLA